MHSADVQRLLANRILKTMRIGHISFIAWIQITESCIFIANFHVRCESGYFGSDCRNRCLYPQYGEGCNYKCECREQNCHFKEGCQVPDDGCSPGYTGQYCEVPCPYPKFGYGCQQTCLCSKSRCNTATGCQYNHYVVFKPNPPTTIRNNFSTDAEMETIKQGLIYQTTSLKTHQNSKYDKSLLKMTMRDLSVASEEKSQTSGNINLCRHSI